MVYNSVEVIILSSSFQLFYLNNYLNVNAKKYKNLSMYTFNTKELGRMQSWQNCVTGSSAGDLHWLLFIYKWSTESIVTLLLRVVLLLLTTNGDPVHKSIDLAETQVSVSIVTSLVDDPNAT